MTGLDDDDDRNADASKGPTILPLRKAHHFTDSILEKGTFLSILTFLLFVLRDGDLEKRLQWYDKPDFTSIYIFADQFRTNNK